MVIHLYIRLEISHRTRWWCLKCVIVYLARDIPVFLMYCVYGESGSSLLIESTDSMIIHRISGLLVPQEVPNIKWRQHATRKRDWLIEALFQACTLASVAVASCSFFAQTLFSALSAENFNLLVSWSKKASITATCSVYV